jgi:hypothetical protein
MLVYTGMSISSVYRYTRPDFEIPFSNRSTAVCGVLEDAVLNETSMSQNNSPLRWTERDYHLITEHLLAGKFTEDW